MPGREGAGYGITSSPTSAFRIALAIWSPTACAPAAPAPARIRRPVTPRRSGLTVAAWRRRLAAGKASGRQVGCGHYAEHPRVYLDLFPRDRFHVLLLEDLVADPAGVVSKIWTFLDVDPDAGHPTAVPPNVSRGALTAALYRTWLVRSLAWRVFRGRGASLERLVDRLRARPPMKAQTRHLLVDHFRDHNRSLERLLERDLSHWDR
jgi:sulfotransferase family protein